MIKIPGIFHHHGPLDSHITTRSETRNVRLGCFKSRYCTFSLAACRKGILGNDLILGTMYGRQLRGEDPIFLLYKVIC